jgi:sensor histidine kinase YesM
MLYSFIFSNRIFVRVSRHLAFWLVFSAWYLFLCSPYPDHFIEYFQWLPLLLDTLPISIFSTYLTLYVLIPRYLLRKEYKSFILVMALLAIFYPILALINPVGLIFNPGQFMKDKAFLFDDVFEMKDLATLKMAAWNGWGLMMAVNGFAAIIKLMKTYYLEHSEQERLKQQKTNQDLQLLKSQLNSRFLFDALQGIQSHVRNQSHGSSDLILRLSDLLSYILYENDAKTVLLDKELEIIEGYLNLEKESNRNKIDFRVTKTGDTDKKRIVPFVLLPLVESCFENFYEDQKNETGLTLDFAIEGLALAVTMEIKNIKSFSQDILQKSLRIKNVQQRLKSYYSGRHELAISADDQGYKILLELGL